MIRSFADTDTRLLWETGRSRRTPASVRKMALRKIAVLDSAEELNDLVDPPGNRLEALKRDRKGQHSIRINNRYRLCFASKQPDAFEVEIVDYH